MEKIYAELIMCNIIKDKLFHLNEPFQLINSREKI